MSRSQLSSPHNQRSRSAQHSKVYVKEDRSTLLTRWINNLGINKQLTTKEVIERTRTGVLAFKLIQKLDKTSFTNCSETPKTRQDCLNNISAVFDKLIFKGFKISGMTSMDIYNGVASKIWLLMEAIFTSYAMTEIYAEFDKILSWMHLILNRYNQVLQPSTFKHPYVTLREDMANGVNILCILHHHYKNTKHSPVLRKVIWEPKNTHEMYSNVAYMYDKIQELRIPLCFDVSEFCNLDNDFIMMQVYWIYQDLRTKAPISTSLLIMKEVPEDHDNLRNSSPHSSEKSSISTSARSEALEFNSTQGSRFTTEPIILHGLSFGKLIPLVTDPSHSSSPERMSLDPEQIISPTNISPSSLNRNLQIMERKVMEQEKFCMYISDIRRKKETSIGLSNSPSLRSMRSVSKSHSSFHIQNPKYSTTNLSHVDNLICYLITPRILKLAVDQDAGYLPYMFSLTPHSNQFTLEREAYILEWRDLRTMKIIGKINTVRILSVKRSGNREVTITSPEKGSQSIMMVEYKLQCMDVPEAQTYYDALTYLLHKKTISRNNS